MATPSEIEAARNVLETFAPSKNATQSKARAQLMLEAAERQRAGTPWCPFCKKDHIGGGTCMGHHP